MNQQNIPVLPWLLAACALSACGDNKSNEPKDKNEALSCPSGLEVCGDDCVDLAANADHCGACGETCEDTEVCSRGACAARCADGLSECDGACVNLSADIRACGACGESCAAGERCVDGACGTCAGEEIDTAKFPVDVELDTRKSTDVLRGSCGKGNSPEQVLTFKAPKTGVYEFSTEGSSFNTVLYVLDGGCDGKELACNDDHTGALSSWLSVALTKGQTVAVVVDGLDQQAGEAKLHVVDTSGLQCCEAQNTAGCGIRTVEECVCAVDSFCCTAAWDTTCITTMLENNCGSCASASECKPEPLALTKDPRPTRLKTGSDAV
jgi:hypothetical protein